MPNRRQTVQSTQPTPQFTADRSALLTQMRADATVTFIPALHVDAI